MGPSASTKHSLELIEEKTTLFLVDFESDWQAEAKTRHLQFNMIHADVIVEIDQRLLAVILNNAIGNAVGHTTYGRVTYCSNARHYALLRMLLNFKDQLI